MSGFCGIIDISDRPIDPEWIRSMVREISHRGPDGKGIREEKDKAFGQVLFSLSRESKVETYPLQYHDVTVVADCRLDAREELGKALKVPLSNGFISDSLLIAKAYKTWGTSCTDYLIGDFAFAIWDSRKKSLFCARDHAGVKPFFYFFDGGKFVFASEIRPIATLPFVSKIFNEEKFEELLLTMLWSGEHVAETFFKGINRLMPARRLLLEQKKVTFHKYWEPAPNKTLRLPSDEAYEEALKEKMELAVRDRLQTTYPVGVQLSGGLDSSSIACIAARELARKNLPLFAFSSVLPENHSDQDEDERLFIEAVLNQEKNIRIAYITAQGRKVFKQIDQVFQQVYDPVNPFHYLDDALDEEASNRGVRLVLDGLLGDMTVSYLNPISLAHLVRTGQLSKAFQLLKTRTKVSNRSSWKVFKREIAKPFFPDSVLSLLHQLKGKPDPRLIDLTALNPAVISPKKAEKKYRGGLKKFFSEVDVYPNIWNVNLNLIAEEANVRHAYNNVRHTYPWLDKRIIEFMFSLPPEQFLHKGWERGLIRYAMDGILPPMVQWRKTKGAFSPDFPRRLAVESFEACNKLDTWQKKGEIPAIVDVNKIKNNLKRLEKAKNPSNFDQVNISLLGIGMMACHFRQWFFQIN